MNSTKYTIKDLHIKVQFLTKLRELDQLLLKSLIDSHKPKGAKHGANKTH